MAAAQDADLCGVNFYRQGIEDGDKIGGDVAKVLETNGVGQFLFARLKRRQHLGGDRFVVWIVRSDRGPFVEDFVIGRRVFLGNRSL